MFLVNPKLSRLKLNLHIVALAFGSCKTILALAKVEIKIWQLNARVLIDSHSLLHFFLMFLSYN